MKELLKLVHIFGYKAEYTAYFLGHPACLVLKVNERTVKVRIYK